MSSRKEIPKVKLQKFAELGKDEYLNALSVWGEKSSLYDSLVAAIDREELIGYETDAYAPVTGIDWFNWLQGASGVYKIPGKESWPRHEKTESAPDTVFVSTKSDEYLPNQILAHELGHYFKPHIPKEEYSSILHKLMNKYFGYPEPYDTTKSKGTSSEEFNKMFFSIADKWSKFLETQ